MQLDQIRLAGFKSFAKPVTLTLSQGITAVVGPNGSGKSNIVDAILWVFGEPSLKTIRANEKTDIIFAGSDHQVAASFADVTLCFQRDGKSFDVSRHLTRDGKNDYFINEEKARRKDILDLFEGTGAGKELYSIVSQGRVDKILNSSSEEIRLLIEEAAGIAVYKKKKRETITKILSTEDNLNRINDILAELDKQRKSLYLKAKRAEKFQEYSATLKTIQKEYFSHLSYKLKDQQQVCESETLRLQEALKDLQKEIVQTEAQWYEIKEEFSSTNQEMESFTSVLEQYKERQNHLQDLRNLYSSQQSEKEGQFVESSTRLDAVDKENAKTAHRKEELEILFDSVIANLESIGRELQGLEDQKVSISNEYTEEEKEILELQQQFSQQDKSINKLENELLRLEETIEDHTKRLAVIKNQIESKTERLDGHQNELDELVQSISESSEKETKLVSELNRLKQDYASVEEKIHTIETEKYEMIQRIKHLDLEKNLLEKQIREFSGYTRPVKSLFQRKETDIGFRNMIDVVANLLEVNREYEKAFEVLLMGKSQNIVTLDTQTAKYAVEVLKTNGWGRATFLPIDVLEFKPVVQNPKLLKEPGVIGYAAELVVVDKDFSKLPLYLFKDTLLVETLDDGLRLKKQYNMKNQIVSLDGQFIASSGAITGGSLDLEPSTSLLVRNRKVHEMQEELDALNRSLQKIEKEEKANLKQKHELSSLRTVMESELNDLMLKNSSIRRTVEEINHAIAELSKEIGELHKLRIDYEAKIAGADARKGMVINEIVSGKASLTSLESTLESFGQILKEKKQAMQQLQERLNEVKLEFNSGKERQKQYRAEISDIETRTSENAEKRDEYKHQLLALGGEIETLKEKTKQMDVELDSVKKEMSGLFESMKYQQEERGQKMKKMEELEIQLASLKEERENAREKIHKQELVAQEVEHGYSRLYEKMTQAGLSIELEDSAEESKEKIRLSEEEEESKATQLTDLEQKIKYLGAVDLQAIDEYRDVDARFTDLDGQKKDLEDAKTSLNEVLDKTDKEAKEIFLKTFDAINKNFDEMIQTLFGGGSGELRLMPGADILETGVEISVKRPGKKHQKLYLLSGGEKSLVGIALVFSMLRINPSPFYILDEVDAALDDYNAERLKNLIEKNKDMAQFIVITHNKLMMEGADILYGITQSMGISMAMAVELEKYAVS